MGAFTRFQQGDRRTIASTAAVVVLSAGIATAAVLYDGEATADVDLDDSGVWVTKESAGLVGRFNTQAQAIDGTLLAGSAAFDVAQEAGDVVVADDGNSAASVVDVARLKFASSTVVPPGAHVAMGGGTVAVLDDESASLWVVPVDRLPGLDTGKVDPTVELEGAGEVVVSRDGTAYAVVPSTDTLWTVPVDGEPSSRELGLLDRGDDVVLTTVGDEPVVLDRSDARLRLPGGDVVEVADAQGARLQHPGPATDGVAYATSSGLVVQPLDGGAAVTRRASGVPAAPVQLGGCLYGAWSQTGQVVRDCEGTDRDVDRVLEGIDQSTRLEYRVNRNAVVLNDLTSGTLWMALDEYEKVDDWDVQLPERADGEDANAEDAKPELVDQTVVDRERQDPPVAEDDSYGVRPGRSTVLDVLSNDLDPDGDVITARLVGDQPAPLTVERVLGGKALQAVVPGDASGSVRFRYEVSDGRGGTDEANVDVRVVPWDENAAPEQTGEPVLRVQRGGAGQIKVLPFFRDPDGDDVYLATASATVQGDEVRAYPDGTVEFRDGGSATGRKKVTLTVGDGRGEVVEGTLWVDVLGDGNEPPVAVGDHVVVTAGEPVTVEPLANDSDPNGDELRLVSVSQDAPAEVTPNYDAGTFTFLSHEPRSYDLLYQVSDGPATTTGVVRVDVLDPDAADGPPVVVSDTVMLPAGGSALVDVLANDTDPAGGVLVVQSVRVPEDAGVSVAVLAHQMLRVTETRRIADPVVLEYTVSNGAHTATGEVRVLPVPAPERLQPPNAVADEVTVRVGDYVNVPVLANDTHPDGLELELVGDLEQQVDPALGEAFVSEDRLRFRAGSQAGTGYAIYKVRDRNGQEDSAQVTIHVRDGEDNAPPVPRDVEARVLAGGTVRVHVPLDGIDPDGDSVQLTGLASGPTQGRAEVVDGYVDYAASERAEGGDSFRYTVQDARGAVATGTVRVGIARPPETNQPPVAVDDHVTVRPERRVAVPALLNDSDPDGDQIGLVPGATQGGDEVSPEVVDDRIVVQTPADEGTYTFYYSIEDTYAARASAAVSVTVAADAPLLPPIARDDSVPVAEILGRTSVTVPVLDNDEDPDGAASELEVTTDAPTATVTEDGEVEVELTASRQVVTYMVTDVDGLQAKAFLVVPGLTDAEPILRPGQAPLEVLSGEPLEIDITDHVLVVEGRTPRLTASDQVTAVEGEVAVSGPTTMTYTSDEGYQGPAAVTFEVTDGTGPDDPDAATAVLTLPITVLPPENLPPEPGSPTGQVAAGEESAVDLGRFATDPDEDELRFALGSLPSGLGATLAGSRVTLEAAPDVPKGTVLRVPYTVTDDQHPPVDGTLTVEVVASTRPLARAVEDVVDDAHQGRPVSVPVLANDSNPFADREPLRVVGQPIIETGAGGTVVDGDQVVVTPAQDFVGTMVVRYRVEDATKDPDRQVEGRITINVLGRPEAPARPHVEEVRSQTVVLSWTPPVNNGSEITSYTVRSDKGDTFECATTTCTLEGLTNNVTYTFTVEATNAVGTSDPSPASAEARPDQRPDPPAAPTLTFGDRSLVVTWENATYSDRSPIQSVNLEISPAPANGQTQKVGVTGNRIVWEGLTNGTAYKVRLQAVNLAPEPSEWGEWSATEIPAGPPAAPAAPTAQRVDDPVGGRVRVTWQAPDGNGDTNMTYHLDEYRDGTRTGTTYTTKNTAYAIEGLDDSSNYSFTVRAENKAGTGQASPRSNAVMPYGTPTVPPTPSARLLADTDGKAQVSWGATADFRGPGGYYRVRAIDGAGNVLGPRNGASPYTFTGLTNGRNYVFEVQACNDHTCSAWSARSNSVSPYTVPGTPGVTWHKATATDGHFTVRGTANDGGRPIQRIEWRLSGDEVREGSRSAGQGWPFDVGVGGGYSKSYTLQARACNAAGCGAWASDSGRTDAKPQPSFTVGRGSSAVGQPNCTHSSCGWLTLTIRDAAPNTSFSYVCQSSTGQISSSWQNRMRNGTQARTDGNGNFGEVEAWCYYGRPGQQVWIETSIGTTQRMTW